MCTATSRGPTRPRRSSRASGPLAVVGRDWTTSSCGLVEVDVDGHLQLVGQGPHPRQGGIGDGVGGVRGEGRADQGMVAEALMQLQSLAQVVVGVLGEARGEVDHDHPDQGAHPGIRCDRAL